MSNRATPPPEIPPEAIAFLNKVAPVATAGIRRHVLVCTGSSCTNNDSQETLVAMYDALREKGLLYGKRGSWEGTVVVSTTSSVGFCAIGPAVLVYPDGIWYYGVTAAVVPRIVESHLVNNEPVWELVGMTLPSQKAN